MKWNWGCNLDLTSEDPRQERTQMICNSNLPVFSSEKIKILALYNLKFCAVWDIGIHSKVNGYTDILEF